MITYVDGYLLHAPAQTLVNTVNTVGVMGKGVAKEFKAAFPEMYGEYRRLCELGRLRVGTLWLDKSSHKWVLNFPTKQDWRRPSKPEYVQEGLEEFRPDVRTGNHECSLSSAGLRERRTRLDRPRKADDGTILGSAAYPSVHLPAPQHNPSPRA